MLENNYKKTIGIIFEKTIGDLIYTSSIVGSIRKNEPNSYIHVVTSDLGLEILKSDKPDYDKISKSFDKLLNYDIIYQPLRCAQYVPLWFKYGLHIRDLSSVSIGINLSRKCSNILIPKDNDVSLECLKLKNSRYIIVGNRASSDRLKEIPLNIMNKVTTEISKDLPIFQLGLSQDIPINNCNTDFLGNTSLTECLYLIKNATMLIGIDNFMSHAAGAYGTPTLSVYGQYHVDQVKPIDAHNKQLFINKGILGEFNSNGCNNVTFEEIYDNYKLLKEKI